MNRPIHETNTRIDTLRRSLVVAAVCVPVLSGPAWADIDDDDDDGRSGYVYTSTNAAAGNAIIVLKRGADGSLTHAGSVPTNGLGSGAGLGSQNALALSRDGRWLFAVNAGSHDVSVFRVRNGALVLVCKTASGGVGPLSLTVSDNLLYVLNAGNASSAGNISGFTFNEAGLLKAIAGSIRPLSAAAAAPAQIQFDRDGEALVVTEKATNKISTYSVEDRVAKGPVVNASKGTTPFGFSFDKRNRLIVSEAFGGAANASALSSYNLNDDSGVLDAITVSLADKQSAACWIVITKNGRFGYATNTGSGSISGFRVAVDGKLSLLNADGRTAVTGAGSAPLDAALSRNSTYLYVLTAAVGTINAYRVAADGSLAAVPGASGIATTGAGLVAR